jgi:hypothetical protein
VGKESISVIPQSTEKFISVSISNLKFLDTAQLMASSLDTLLKKLKAPKSQNQFENFGNMKKHFTEEEIELICQKGVYPYEYMNGDE